MRRVQIYACGEPKFCADAPLGCRFFWRAANAHGHGGCGHETPLDGLMRECGGVGPTPLSRWDIHCDPSTLRDSCVCRAVTSHAHARVRTVACGTGASIRPFEIWISLLRPANLSVSCSVGVLLKGRAEAVAGTGVIHLQRRPAVRADPTCKGRELASWQVAGREAPPAWEHPRCASRPEDHPLCTRTHSYPLRETYPTPSNRSSMTVGRYGTPFKDPHFDITLRHASNRVLSSAVRGGEV